MSATQQHARPLPFALFRPYFDLGDPVEPAPLHVVNVSVVREELRQRRPATLGAAMAMIPTFRCVLVHETGDGRYSARSPEQLPARLQTEAWADLCDRLRSWGWLSIPEKVTLLRMLIALTFYEQAFARLQAGSEDDPTLAWLRAYCSFMLGAVDWRRACRAVATGAPSGSIPRLAATLLLANIAVEHGSAVAEARAWRARAEIALQELLPRLAPEDASRAVARLLALRARIAEAAGDQTTARSELARAVAAIEDAPAEGTPAQRFYAVEAVRRLVERQVAVECAAGDLDAAAHHAQRLIRLDPSDCKAHFVAGDVAARSGRVADAARLYRAAARLGPLFTADCWWRAGRCYERCGELDVALDCHLAALRLEPRSPRFASAVARVAQDLGVSAIVNWASERWSACGALEPVPLATT